jgi:hypothetical protein
VPRAEVSSAPAYFEKKTILSPNSITMCSLRVPEIIRGTMPPGTASVEGSSQFMNQSNCHPWLLAIVDVKEDGLIKAGVMNTLDQPVTIQSGQQYGIVTLTCDVNEAHFFQARLPTIRHRSSPTSTPTTLTDATLRAQSVNSLSGNSPTCHQTAPQSRDRSRNNLGRHLPATREEPEVPSSGNSIDTSRHQGKPPAQTELGAPPTGKMESSHHQGAPPAHTAFGVPSMNPSWQSSGAPPNQSELGTPSASQLGKPQGAPPDQAEIGTSSNCRRLAWIEEEFSLQNNPNLWDPVDLKKAQSLLLAYWDVLSKEGKYGQTSLIEHEIKTTPGHPIKNRIRPLNLTLEADLRKQIDKWQLEGVIEPSMSPWNFGLVAAPKKSGTIRWCVDFRGLNQRSIVDSHPLPNIKDNLSRLSRSCFYSTLDGVGTYHVVPIKK